MKLMMNVVTYGNDDDDNDAYDDDERGYTGGQIPVIEKVAITVIENERKQTK